MEKKNQIPKYPHLRFPEFTDEWKEVKLGEVTCERNETNTPTLPLLSITANKGVIPQTDSEKKDVSNADKSKYKRICSGDIGYNTMRMWQGRSALSFIEGIVSPAYTIVTPLKGVSPLFLSYLIKRPRLIYEFWTHSQGLVEDTLNCKYKDFAQITITIPSLSEQRKIAALLSLIDERIEVQNAIIKEQEAQKAALLRRLFDRTLRFPEFTDEWKEVKLGEVTCERNETNAPTLPLLSITVDKGIVLQTDSEKKDVSNADKSKYKRICSGDIGYNTMRMWQGRSALSFVEGIVSPAYTIVTPVEGFSPLFLSYLIKRPRLIYEFWTHSQGLVEDTLNCKYKDFAQINITIPSLPEQRKIAALLSAVDERLSVERECAEQLKQQKAYLLRQMFI